MKATYSKQKTKRRLPLFWLIMLLVVVINTGVIGYLLMRFSVLLADFEAGTPGAALLEYLNAVNAGSFEDIMEDSGFEPSPLNSRDDYTAMLSGRIGGLENPEFRKTSAQTSDGWEQYILLDGDSEVAPVWLAPASEESGRRWRVRCDYEYLPGYTITVPQHLEVYVCGRRLGEENSRVERIPVPVFAMLPEEDRPVRLRYVTEPTLYEQEITLALTDGGYELGVEPGQDSARRLEGWEVLSESRELEYKILIENAAKAYAAYITNDGDFSSLSDYLLPGTDFYNGVKTFDRRWYIPHDGFGFENILTGPVVMWSQDAFSGKISFDYLIHAGNRTHTYPTSYQMAFVRDDERWKLIHIQVQ